MNVTPYYHLKINNLDTVEALSVCEQALCSERNHSVFFLNAHCFNLSMDNPIYVEALTAADLVLNDGIGIKIGAKLQGLILKENMNGTDFIPQVLSLARDEKKKVFFLGAKPGIAAEAKLKLESQYPGLDVVGTRSGYFTPQEETDLLEEINLSGASILVVGMGVPAQEIWIHRHRTDLKNIRISLAGGAIFDFFAGRVKRAPVILQKMGLEWVFRLAQEPFRLFNRYILGNWVFMYNVMVRSKLKR